MRSPRSTRIAVMSACVLFAVAHAVGAAAQEHTHADMTMPDSGIRAEMIRDLERLEQRYLGLADALVAHYAWRPGDGVRSTSEVLMHVANANFLLPNMVGIAPPAAIASMERGALERVTDPAELREHLAHSFRHLRHAIARTPDAELDEMTTLFGQPATKRAVLTLSVSHVHEHLGQAIAYARMNGVTPPWSQGN